MEIDIAYADTACFFCEGKIARGEKVVFLVGTDFGKTFRVQSCLDCFEEE